MCGAVGGHERSPLSLQAGLAPMVPFLKACVERLPEAFDDIPGVIKNERFCQRALAALPHAAVMEWMKLDSLVVHSENCIRFLVSA